MSVASVFQRRELEREVGRIACPGILMRGYWATGWPGLRLPRPLLRREAEYRKTPIPMAVTFWTAVLAA
eukprot:602615-Alexandrium_andersonii.AAC.1